MHVARHNPCCHYSGKQCLSITHAKTAHFPIWKMSSFCLLRSFPNPLNHEFFGRTEKPQGKLYENKPRIEKIHPEMEQFITMCFEPGSAMNERLKETLLQMLKEEAK